MPASGIRGPWVSLNTSITITYNSTIPMNTTEATERRVRYDENFKAEAIRLWKTSHRPARIVAKELGISVATLYLWGRDVRPNGGMVAGHL